MWCGYHFVLLSCLAECSLRLQWIYILLLFCGQEIIILTISTMFIEEEGLQAVNVVGMVVCIMGVTLHTLMKALRARGDERGGKGFKRRITRTKTILECGCNYAIAMVTSLWLCTCYIGRARLSRHARQQIMDH